MPTQIELEIPEGWGKVWYVIIRGHEPGLYRTPYVLASLHSALVTDIYLLQRRGQCSDAWGAQRVAAEEEEPL